VRKATLEGLLASDATDRRVFKPLDDDRLDAGIANYRQRIARPDDDRS